MKRCQYRVVTSRGDERMFENFEHAVAFTRDIRANVRWTLYTSESRTSSGPWRECIAS